MCFGMMGLGVIFECCDSLFLRLVVSAQLLLKKVRNGNLPAWDLRGEPLIGMPCPA